MYEKILVILSIALLVSCNRFVVSSRDAIIKKVELNTYGKKFNTEKYRIYAEYVNGTIYIPTIYGRDKSSGFVLYTDTKYNVGDTIRLAK